MWFVAALLVLGFSGLTLQAQTGSTPDRGRTPGAASRPGAPARNAAPAPGAGATPAAGTERQPGLIGRAVQFIIRHSTWIIAALGVGLLGSLAFLYLSSRRQRDRESEDESVELIPLRDLRHDEEDEEDEGPRRVLIDPATGRPREMPSRDDSEYALVVDEEQLHTPHGDDRVSSGEFEKCVLQVKELMRKKDYDGAFKHYAERIRKHKLAAFHPQIERRLGNHFLRNGDLKRAALILEHHVSTQPDTRVEPETYFDLGYIHFKNRTLRKCQHFFRLFAERERDSERSERARKLLGRLEKVQNLN